MERELIFPAIYKHFKHDKNGSLNNYMYVVIGTAKTIDEVEIYKYEGIKELGLFNETETNHKVRVFYNNENTIFIPVNNDIIHNGEYVIYKSLYDGESYIRPKEMFFSEVDRLKYPNVKQQYRFELINK